MRADILHIIATKTPIGTFRLITDEQDIVRASGFAAADELARRLPKELQGAPQRNIKDHPYQELVRNYFNGTTTALDNIPRSQDGSEFQQRIWRAISNIGHGQSLSYKQLAAVAGYPNAIRAAGTACGQNRLVLLVPCHRVLKSDGSIGNYLDGPSIKEQLLRREGATVLQ